MKKIATALIFPVLILLCSCDIFSTKKVKHLTDLTPKLYVNSNEAIILDEIDSSFDPNISWRKNSYNFTKNSIISQPTCAKKIMFTVNNKGLVSAYSIQDKKILWTQNDSKALNDTSYIGGGITYSNNKLYVTNGSKYLIILDSATGYELIRKEFPDIIRSKPVIIRDNVILVQTVSNQVFAYDIDNAKYVWRHEGIAETLSSSNYINPIIYNSKAILNYNSGVIIALDQNSGKEEWSIDLSKFTASQGVAYISAATASCQPILVDNDIYIAISAGKLLKINLSTGNIVWNVSANDVQSMRIFGNSLYIITNGNQIGAVSLINGSMKWVANLNTELKRSSKTEFFSVPFFSKDANGVVNLNVFGSQGRGYSFSYINGVIDSNSKVFTIPKNLKYSDKSCCINSRFIIADKKVIFID